MKVDKECPQCGKPVVGKSNKIYCSESCCSIVGGRRRRSENPEYYRLKRLRENADMPRKMLCRVKGRAKKFGIPFNLEYEDILIPEVCPVLGIKIKTDRKLVTSPSLDRIDPTLGYTKGNVRVISNRANILKSNATVEELELILKDLKEIHPCAASETSKPTD